MPDSAIGRDVKDRLAQVAVEDFLRDTASLEEVARMTTDNLYKDMLVKVQEQVKGIINGLDIPQQIRDVAARSCSDNVPIILQRNVPPMVEGLVSTHIGWYRERIASFGVELEDSRTKLAEESGKRRKIQRAYVALQEKVDALEERLNKLEPQEVEMPEKKTFFSWKRTKRVPLNQGADYM